MAEVAEQVAGTDLNPRSSVTESPRPDRAPRAPLVVVALLSLSALALGVAPFVLPSSYDWISQTTSESGAQALAGAWVARLGFLTFGLAVLLLGSQVRDVWWRSTVWLHMVFGASMVAAAAFSHRPWIADVPFDALEDTLHSIAATGMGFAFAAGVAVRFVQRRSQRAPGAGLDLVAILAATALPVAMMAVPAWAGLFQRAMFVVAYVWYGREALNARAP